MPASYVHQCVAKDAAHALGLFEEDQLRAALLAGSEGPDPFFFSLFALPGTLSAPKLGSLMHTKKTGGFLLALAKACSGDAITRAFCCGFFSHYGTDTTFHPFIYAHSLLEDGSYSSTAHCTLEHQLETLHYRRQGHAAGLPLQMGGFIGLRSHEKDEIARALTKAIQQVFPGEGMTTFRIRRSFDDAVNLCNILRSERGVKFRALGSMLRPFHLDASLHAHMMPAEPPQADVMNDAHKPWASIWLPGSVRTDSFDDLYAAAVERGKALMRTANSYMLSGASYATLRALHGGLSYDSGLPWQTTCAPAKAPVVGRR